MNDDADLVIKKKKNDHHSMDLVSYLFLCCYLFLFTHNGVDDNDDHDDD